MPFDALSSMDQSLRKVVGTLDSASRSSSVFAKGMAITALETEKAKEAFEKLRNGKFADIFKGLPADIKAYRDALVQAQAAEERMVLKGKLIESMTFSNPIDGAHRLSQAVGTIGGKFKSSFDVISSTLSSTDKKFGDLKGTLLDFNRATLEVAKISQTLGRNEFFNGSVWNKVSKNTALGKKEFTELYQTYMEMAKGLPMTSNAFADFAKILSEKFGYSLKTVELKMRNLLEIQAALPKAFDDLTKFSQIDMFDKPPSGLKETVFLLNQMGISQRSINTYVQATQKTTLAQKALMQYEKVVAERNKKIENANVNMAKSTEDSLVRIEKVMGNLADTAGRLGTELSPVIKQLMLFSQLSMLTQMSTPMLGMMSRGATLAGGGRGASGGLAGGALMAGTAVAMYGAYKMTSSQGEESSKYTQSDLDTLKSGGFSGGKTAEIEEELARENANKKTFTKWGASAGGAIGLIAGGASTKSFSGATKGAAGGAMFGGFVGGLIDSKIGSNKNEEIDQQKKIKAEKEKILIWDKLIRKELKGASLLTKEQPKDLKEALVLVGKIKGEQDQIEAILALQSVTQKSDEEIYIDIKKYGDENLLNLAKQAREKKKFREESDAVGTNFMRLNQQYVKLAQSNQTILQYVDQWKSGIDSIADQMKTLGIGGDMVTRQYEERLIAVKEQNKLLESQKVLINQIAKDASEPNKLDKDKVKSNLEQSGASDKTAELMSKEMENLVNLKSQLLDMDEKGISIEDENRKGVEKKLEIEHQRLFEKAKELNLSDEELNGVKMIINAYATKNEQELMSYTNAEKTKITNKLALGILEETNTIIGKSTQKYENMAELMSRTSGLAEEEQKFIENSNMGMAASFESRKKIYDITVSQRHQLMAAREEMAKNIQSQEVMVRAKITQRDVEKMMYGDSLSSAQALATMTEKIDKMDNVKDREAAQLSLNQVYNKSLDLNKQILNTKNKELELTMQMREGFLDVIDEMTTGSDLVSQLLPTAQRGQASLLNLSRMMAGADFGGSLRTGFMSTGNMAGTNASTAARYGSNGLIGNMRPGSVGRYASDIMQGGPFNAQNFSGVQYGRSNFGETGMPGYPGVVSMSNASNQFDEMGSKVNNVSDNLEQFSRSLQRANGNILNGGSRTYPNNFGVSGFSSGGYINLKNGGKINTTPSAGRDNVFGKFSNGEQVLLGGGESFIPKNKIGGQAGYDSLNAMNEAGRRGMTYDLGDGGFILNRRATNNSGMRGFAEGGQAGNIQNLATTGMTMKMVYDWVAKTLGKKEAEKFAADIGIKVTKGFSANSGYIAPEAAEQTATTGSRLVTGSRLATGAGWATVAAQIYGAYKGTDEGMEGLRETWGNVSSGSTWASHPFKNTLDLTSLPGRFIGTAVHESQDLWWLKQHNDSSFERMEYMKQRNKNKKALKAQKEKRSVEHLSEKIANADVNSKIAVHNAKIKMPMYSYDEKIDMYHSILDKYGTPNPFDIKRDGAIIDGRVRVMELTDKYGYEKVNSAYSDVLNDEKLRNEKILALDKTRSKDKIINDYYAHHDDTVANKFKQQNQEKMQDNRGRAMFGPQRRTNFTSPNILADLARAGLDPRNMQGARAEEKRKRENRNMNEYMWNQNFGSNDSFIDGGAVGSVMSGVGNQQAGSMNMSGGINIDRLYLGGKLYGENLKSDGQDLWRKMEVFDRT